MRLSKQRCIAVMGRVVRCVMVGCWISGMLGASMGMANEAVPLPKRIWSFDGMVGTLDRQAAQRGFQVYHEVCSVCHGVHLLAYRDLQAIGFSEAEVKALAAAAQVQDGPNEGGEMFMRPARPADRIVPPYPNEQAARAANNGAYPVDMSLLVKARPDGANYIHALITGYHQTPPAGVEAPMDGLYYNPYFPGHFIAMPPPLSDDQVTYQDGTKATVDQMVRDVVVFLQWAAEPEMEHRKKMGLRTLLFLACLTVFFYLAKRVIWRPVS